MTELFRMDAQMRDTTFIYTLICPITHETKYVGETIVPSRKYSQIQSEATPRERLEWIKDLKKQGLKPIMIITDEVPVEEGFDAKSSRIKTEVENGNKLFNKLNRKNPNASSTVHGKTQIINANSVKVDMYTIHGKFVKTWDSQVQASDSLGTAQNNISKAMSRCTENLSACGYLWVAHGESIDHHYNAYADKFFKPISIFDLNGDFKTSYSSLDEAVDKLGCSKALVTNCAKGRKPSIGRNIVTFTNEEYTIGERLTKLNKMIYIYNNDGSLFGKFLTLKEASLSIGVSRERVRQVVTGGGKVKGKIAIKK